MKNVAQIVIHASQFPENVQYDLLVSLRTRRVNHKFHYDSLKQTQKWLALHEAHSPARRDADCLATYNRAFIAAAGKIAAKQLHVIGLGCGGGQKDVRLLQLLKTRGKKISYAPCDVSTAMVLVARRAALRVVPANQCFPVVCDLATADDLPDLFSHGPSPQAPRLVTFFGMIPNFEPLVILPKLASLVRPQDYLLFSANLAPGKDYTAGMKRILPQYDNALTREWLMTFLLDLGVERKDGSLDVSIASGASGSKRVVAGFRFARSCRIKIEDKLFSFRRGETIRLFFSYRYTPERIVKILERHGLQVSESWIANSGEEGVFFCRPNRSTV